MRNEINALPGKNEYDVYHFHRLFKSVYSTILLPSSRKTGAAKRFVPEDLQFLAVAHPTGEVYNRESDKRYKIRKIVTEVAANLYL